MQARPTQFRYGTLAAAVVLALGPATASAAAFQLLEQGAKGQGTSFAGTATNWEDTATAFWNPAGMARHNERSVTLGGSVIDVSFDFEDDGSTLNAGGAGNLTYDELSGLGLSPNADAKGDSDAGETAFVPNFYYIQPLRNGWTAGFALNVPFGLESDYDEEWVGRYHATHSELTTINLNPSIAYQLNDSVSVGAGINIQYAEATLANRVDPEAAGAGVFGTAPGTFGGRGDPDNDSDAEIEGDNWGAGLNLGLLADLTERTRLGISYRGHVTHSVEGDIDYNHRNDAFAATAEGADVFVNADANATLDLPETLTISMSRDSTRLENVTIMADVTWTRWSRLDELKVEYDSDQPDTVEELDFEDTTRLALGATWDASAEWQWRAGIAYDQSPVPDAESRSPRVPDSNRRWFSAGFGYQPAGSDFALDVGYSHIRVDDTSIDRNNAFGDNLRGDYESDVNILAVQGLWRF